MVYLPDQMDVRHSLGGVGVQRGSSSNGPRSEAARQGKTSKVGCRRWTANLLPEVVGGAGPGRDGDPLGAEV